MKLVEKYLERVQSGALKRDPVQLRAIDALERLGDELSAPKKRGIFSRRAEPVKGLYIWGGVGRGKSMLMDLFVETQKVPTRRVHFHAFMQDVHAAMHRARSDNKKDALQPFLEDVASKIRLLALDELQITDITDAMIVGRLFEGLIQRGVAVVATSNRKPDDLYKNGLNRQLFLPFIDILKREMVVHELASATDYRLDRLTDEKVYFAPADAAAKEEIDKLWTDLSGGTGSPLSFVVNEREVVIPCFGNGVARASFLQLCGAKLGPADYLAIASHIRVLILENIPRLGRSNFNEAKRFVTLIDALYEARVKLIASAEAEPNMLYIEGAGSFEFERTASRLIEMQSAEWVSS